MKLGWVLEDTKYPEEKINNHVKLVPPQQQQQLSQLYDLRSAGKKMLEGERGRGGSIGRTHAKPLIAAEREYRFPEKGVGKRPRESNRGLFSVFFFCGNFREKSEGIIFCRFFKSLR